jgi:glutamyl-tRNA synthetase
MAKQLKVISEDGYYPEAFINMLALLGWNPGTEQEIFSLDATYRMPFQLTVLVNRVPGLIPEKGQSGLITNTFRIQD